jgi:hypothetical protein
VYHLAIVTELELNMLTSKSNIVAKFAREHGLEVIDVQLPEIIQFAEISGFPRGDAKTLVAIALRRQAQEELLVSEAD